MQKIMYALLFLLVSQLAQAKLEIEIIQGNASALPIAIIPMQWNSSDLPPENSVAGSYHLIYTVPVCLSRWMNRIWLTVRSTRNPYVMVPGVC